MVTPAVVNPGTGAVVFGPETGHTVRVVPRPDWSRGNRDLVYVHVSPSLRGPHMAYDLASYPPAWVVER
jgi:hypothetical protein